MRRTVLAFALIAVACLSSHAQWGRRNRGMDGPLTGYNRNGVPDWPVDANFKDDVFTFVRIKYDSYERWSKWATDYPPTATLTSRSGCSSLRR